MNKMDINNLTDFEILVFLKSNRSLLVTELAKKEEIEDNLGRKFTEGEWIDFTVYVDQFFEDVKEDFINKILEAYKNDIISGLKNIFKEMEYHKYMDHYVVYKNKGESKKEYINRVNRMFNKLGKTLKKPTIGGTK